MDRKDELLSDNINKVTGRKFSQMTGMEKIKHIGKVIVFILTAGMAYPNIFSD